MRLTGSNGEPCPGELVGWTMTGDGSLLADQSTTDGNGYAFTQYVAPFSIVTSPTITATVLF
jgi:hypothetical protein